MVIGEDGIVESVCEQNVFGTIKDLAVIPLSSKLHSNSLQVTIFHLDTEYFFYIDQVFYSCKDFSNG